MTTLTLNISLGPGESLASINRALLKTSRFSLIPSASQSDMSYSLEENFCFDEDASATNKRDTCSAKGVVTVHESPLLERHDTMVSESSSGYYSDQINKSSVNQNDWNTLEAVDSVSSNLDSCFHAGCKDSNSTLMIAAAAGATSEESSLLQRQLLTTTPTTTEGTYSPNSLTRLSDRRESDESTVMPSYSRRTRQHILGEGLLETIPSTAEHTITTTATAISTPQDQQATQPKLYSAIFGSMDQGLFLHDSDRHILGGNKKYQLPEPHSQRTSISSTPYSAPGMAILTSIETPEPQSIYSINDTLVPPLSNNVPVMERSELGPPQLATTSGHKYSSSLRPARNNDSINDKRVQINDIPTVSVQKQQQQQQQPDEFFRPSSDAYTPRLKDAPLFKPAPERLTTCTSNMGSISRPNFRDSLRRVAMILHKHISKIEQRKQQFSFGSEGTGLFLSSMSEAFQEENFVTPRFHCTMVRIPGAFGQVICVQEKIQLEYDIPSEQEIYEFAHQLFKSVQLSSECSIVCLIYIERLMETAKVPLLGTTWRPILLAGLLLASKVWQDLSSWNIEFATVYPQFGLDAINRLELLFLKKVKWDLCISSRCVSFN
jgi:hypothetical protein